jgi:peptidoglycan hydrolase-like protein with peptidoglycan-binding domain
LRGETDYVKACNNVAKDEYATSPTYATTLLSVCNKYKLYEWNAEALDKPVEKQDCLTPGEYYPTLRKGDKNEYVYHWQKFLNVNGYDCGVEDGIFGPNTERAVKNWQKAHGLVPDGIIGPKTWNTVGKGA